MDTGNSTQTVRKRMKILTLVKGKTHDAKQHTKDVMENRIRTLQKLKKRQSLPHTTTYSTVYVVRGVRSGTWHCSSNNRQSTSLQLHTRNIHWLQTILRITFFELQTLEYLQDLLWRSQISFLKIDFILTRK